MASNCEISTRRYLAASPFLVIYLPEDILLILSSIITTISVATMCIEGPIDAKGGGGAICGARRLRSSSLILVVFCLSSLVFSVESKIPSFSHIARRVQNDDKINFAKTIVTVMKDWREENGKKKNRNWDKEDLRDEVYDELNVKENAKNNEGK